MIQSIAYRITRIETLQFAIFPDAFQSGPDVRIDTNFEYNVRSDIGQIRNVLKISYVQNDKLLLVAELACYFDIAPEGAQLIKAQGKVPVDFLRFLGSVSVGTIRGLIHAKTEGTVLNPIILPPVNLEDMIKNDMELRETTFS